MISDVHDGDETRDTAAESVANDLVCLGDYEECARARMTPAAAGFLASGVGDEITVRANREAFTRMRLRPRALVDVSRIDTHVRLLGRDHPLPIVLAPTAYTGVFHPEGERAVARGAHDAGVTYTVASFSTTAIEDIRAESAGALWFQLYMLSDRGLMREIMARAEAAGCEAFCLTVDHPVPGARNQERRARFELPNGLRRVHLDKLGDAAGRLGRPVSGGRNLYNPLMDASVTWTDAAALIASTRLPVLVKGILDTDDAELAIESGAAAIVVSNHGGRTVDQLPATLDALPAIVERVAGRVPVLVDGGVRRGTDVVIARALGADAVLIGRPYVHGLVVAGAAGVTQVVNILRQELEMAMALLGRTSLDRIDRSVFWSA
jgi:4-hydroxymandelate oxidase